MKDKELATNEYKAQTYLIFLCWLMYVASYVARYSYNANITVITTAFFIQDYSKTGLVTTCFFFAYGIGQVVCGLLCKRFNKRLVLFGAMQVSAMVNFLIFLGIDFAFYKYLWFINGAALSTLWCSLILTLSENVETKRLRTAILVMGTTVASGTFIAYGVSALCALFEYWKITFLLAAILVASAGFVWLFSYNRVVSERQKGSETPKQQENVRASKGLWWTLIALAFFAVVCNLIKDGLMTWVPSILKKQYGFKDSLSIILTLTLPLVGFGGIALVAYLKKKANNFVGLTGIFYIGALLCLIGVLVAFDLTSWLPLVLFFALVYCFMSGVNNIVTASAPLYLRGQINSGVLAGVLDGFCYVGSTISAYGLGTFADYFGWKAVFILLSGMAAIAVFIAILFAMINRRKKDVH